MKVLLPVLLLTLWSFPPARAWEVTPSFQEWHDTMQSAFKVLQSQEDKLLDPAKALSFVRWPREWRTAIKPDDATLEIERHRDAAIVESVETCRSALLLGVALVSKAQGKLREGPSPIGLDGAIPFESFATKYVSLAEKCEDGLHLPHPANGLRARFASSTK